jgi:hypothetical protein
MIYQLLLNKAATLNDQPYKAKAYKKAAESVAAWLYDLRNDYVLAVPNVGPSIAKYITDFNNHACSISFCPTCQMAAKPQPPIIKRETAGGGPAVPQCVVPANQPIYQALIDKAASYPAEKAYQAKAYKKVAENLLNFELSIYENYYNLMNIDGVGQSIEDFVWFFIRNETGAAPQRLHPITQEPFPAEGFTSACWGAKTKGSGPFGYLADNDETEEDEFSTTLIPTCDKMTVQQLIDALQAAVKKNPAVASMEVVPDLLDDSNNLGPYEVTIDSNVVFITSGHRNPY